MQMGWQASTGRAGDEAVKTGERTPPPTLLVMLSEEEAAMMTAIAHKAGLLHLQGSQL